MLHYLLYALLAIKGVLKVKIVFLLIGSDRF